MDIVNKIIYGNTLKEIKKLPDDFVDTIITSPPYWGLRDYGEETQIVWDGDENCNHQWKKIIEKKHSGSTKSSFHKEKKYKTEWKQESGFCQKCSAWYGQLGLEPTLDLFLKHLLQITTELKRVLKPTGVMFWNHGDSYGSHRDWTYSDIPLKKQLGEAGKQQIVKKYEKCLMFQNYRLILQMIDQQGWILRNTIIWHKPNHMPSSVKDRFANAYEPVFMLVKEKKYWFDLDAVRQPHDWVDKRGNRIGSDTIGWSNKRKKFKNTMAGGGTGVQGHSGSFKKDGTSLNHPMGKNPGDVWKIATQPFPEAHFATFPEKLIEPMILSSCPKEICNKCGKARDRIIEKYSINPRIINGKESKEQYSSGEEGFVKVGSRMGDVSIKTIGWTDCKCNTGFESGIVLDPFIGSGTVAIVAKRLGRNYIGIDISSEYCEMAKIRIKTQPQPMF